MWAIGDKFITSGFDGPDSIVYTIGENCGDCKGYVKGKQNDSVNCHTIYWNNTSIPFPEAEINQYVEDGNWIILPKNDIS